MVVEIPAIEQHCGLSSNLGTFWIPDYCPKCGARRGVKRWTGFSFDGSRRLVVDCWQNECGHIDKYADVRKEGILLNRARMQPSCR